MKELAPQHCHEMSMGNISVGRGQVDSYKITIQVEADINWISHDLGQGYDCKINTVEHETKLKPDIFGTAPRAYGPFAINESHMVSIGLNVMSRHFKIRTIYIQDPCADPEQREPNSTL